VGTHKGGGIVIQTTPLFLKKTKNERENSTLNVRFQKEAKTNVFAQIPKINQNSIVLIVL
jgi:hypothetical protein